MTSPNVKACQPCRTAKTKCDLTRPTCGRCNRLKIRCQGYTADADFVFRNENKVAQRNSERARKQNRQSAVPLAVRTSRGKKISLPSPPSSASSADGNSSSIPGDSSRTASVTESDQTYIEQLLPLSLPAQVSRPVVDRAMDRYFYDWITRPISEGKPAGALVQLPMLYFTSADESTLRSAFHAAAFAHLRYEFDGTIPFHYKARQAYGAALGHMQRDISNTTFIHDPRSLAALLLLDNFEVLSLGYLTAGDSHHRDGMRHVLAARGEKQFNSAADFTLWSIALQRLICRQVLIRKVPHESQLRLITRLNLDRPDLRLMHDLVQMATLIGKAHTLVHDFSDIKLSEQLRQAHALVQDIVELCERMRNWLTALPEVWKPRQVNGWLADEHNTSSHSKFLPPNYYGPVASDVDRYQAIWLASMFNVKETTEIVLRESLIELYELIEVLSPDADPVAMKANKDHQKGKITATSDAILDTFPMFVEAAAEVTDLSSLQRSRDRLSVGGRFFAMFSMWVFVQCKNVPSRHKRVAEWLNASVRADYALP